LKIYEIETPALLLDMGAVEGNLEKMAAFFRQTSAKLRPHFKNHKCPALASRQLAAGAIGMTCATIAEAECLVRHGIQSVLIANEIADPVKIGRFVDLAGQAEVMVCVDNEKVVAAIATAAASKGIHPGVLVDIDVGLHRCGVPPGETVARLAKAVLEKGLRFRGLMGYEGRVRMPYGPEKVEVCNATMRLLIESRDLVARAGIPVEIVSGGGTSSYRISGRYPGITEIQAGSYLVMDTDYLQCCTDFQLALSLVTTVISKTDGERAVVDAGFKALSGERGLPSVKGIHGVRLTRLNAEHGIVHLEDPSVPLGVGDKIEFWVRDADATINLHECIYGIRNGEVGEVLRIEG
jgi:D-serine deaminase-like pyridoxal phosphate-dependent protein